jgi:HPt (histidine-containing phosphotransfer) domain-containing protein
MAGSDLPDCLPGLEIAQALGRMGGHADLLLKLLGDFRTLNADEVAQIRAALAEEREPARRKAHSLKGTAAVFGATNLFEAARVLEYAIRDGLSGDELERAFEETSRALQVVLQSIDQLLPPTAT